MASLLVIDASRDATVAATGQEHGSSTSTATCNEFDLDDSPSFGTDEEHHDYLHTHDASTGFIYAEVAAPEDGFNWLIEWAFSSHCVSSHTVRSITDCSRLWFGALLLGCNVGSFAQL